MTNPSITQTTPAFFAQSAISFGVALSAALVGIWNLPAGLEKLIADHDPFVGPTI